MGEEYTRMTDDEVEQYVVKSTDRFIGAVESIANSLEQYVKLLDQTTQASLNALKAQTELANSMRDDITNS